MIENTSNRNPIEHLVGCMGGNTSNYVQGMEKSGQQQLLNSDLLPAEAGTYYGDDEGPARDGWTALEELGFQRGNPVNGDPLFVHATLPEGWSREGSEHAMHSTIVDERGVKRVRIFYKAAFYDRRASMSIVVNPGSDLASDLVYEDVPVALPAVWEVLTDEERAGFRRALDHYLREAERFPGIYGDREPRARKLVELVEAAA